MSPYKEEAHTPHTGGGCILYSSMCMSNIEGMREEASYGSAHTHNICNNIINMC